MELSELRARIDVVNDQILDLFLERMDLVEQIGEYKRANGLPVRNRQREREILSAISAKAGDKDRFAHHLFSTIIKLACAREAEQFSGPSAVESQIEAALTNGKEVFPKAGTIACQGVEGANSQIACDRLFPRGNIVYFKSFADVVTAVEQGQCEFGVLPIENSSNGSVRAVYSLLQEHSLSIVRSIRMCIRHELLALPGTKIEDIKEIYSHEQAIGQCSQYLSTLKGVKVIPCANTAIAAQMVAQSGNPHIAAISSHPCAELYGLKCLNDRIQNSENNYTRFFCVAKDPAIYAGSNRIQLVLSCDNRPGALYDILSKLAVYDINMTKLESCPVVGRNFEFIFFLELEASVKEPGVLAMLADIERSCQDFQFLGNYSEV